MILKRLSIIQKNTKTFNRKAHVQIYIVYIINIARINLDRPKAFVDPSHPPPFILLSQYHVNKCFFNVYIVLISKYLFVYLLMCF